MARLFIIGNGYDVSRRGDTCYINFKQWLIDNYTNKRSKPLGADEKNNTIFSLCNKLFAYPLERLQELLTVLDETEKSEYRSLCSKDTLNRKIVAIFVLYNGIP